MTGVQLIAAERREQIMKHRRTVLNDHKTNTNNELGLAAMRLIMQVSSKNVNLPSWPEHWDKKICAKMDAKTDFEKMVIAGALIAADVDRRQCGGCGPGKDYDEFLEAVRPAMEYLAVHHHPHTTAIVTSTNGQLMEGVKGTGEIMDYIQD
jgi:broad specificity phosphatase PhoE